MFVIIKPQEGLDGNMKNKKDIRTKMNKNKLNQSPKVLGLDVSTRTIGVALFDIQTKELLELTHISPVPKPKVENKIEELILKGRIFRKKLKIMLEWESQML